MTRETKINIIDDAISLLEFHIGSSHSDTDDTELKTIKDLEDLLKTI